MMFRRWILLILIFVVGGGVIQAHDTNTVTRITYYLKADANGVQQVYQLPLNGQNEARQISHAENDVKTFGAAYDGLSVAYISGGQLWLQPIHTEEAEALAPVEATQFLRRPIFSPDGQYVAYPNDGVWLFDLGTRQTRQLLADVKVDESASNTKGFRLYLPGKFVMGADGKAVKLVVDVGIWEWNTVGVYDLTSGDFQLLEGQVHTDLLPLNDGRVLLFGNSGVAGEPVLHLAESLEDINQYREVVKFGAVTSSTLFAQQAVEIETGIIRVFGEALPVFPDEVKLFYLDYNLTTNVVGQLHMVHVQNSSGGNVLVGNPSPDGQVLPVYVNAQLSEAASPYGDFSLIDLSQNDEAKAFDGTIGLFQWQPQ